MSKVVVFQIKLGKNTHAHGATLAKAGYATRLREGVLEVATRGAMPPVVTLAEYAHWARAGYFANYTTRIKFDDGRVLYGVPAACRLGALSAFMGKEVKG